MKTLIILLMAYFTIGFALVQLNMDALTKAAEESNSGSDSEQPGSANRIVTVTSLVFFFLWLPILLFMGLIAFLRRILK